VFGKFKETSLKRIIERNRIKNESKIREWKRRTLKKILQRRLARNRRTDANPTCRDRPTKEIQVRKNPTTYLHVVPNRSWDKQIPDLICRTLILCASTRQFSLAKLKRWHTWRRKSSIKNSDTYVDHSIWNNPYINSRASLSIKFNSHFYHILTNQGLFYNKYIYYILIVINILNIN